MVGRKTKLTPELMAKVYNYIRAGNYAVVACQAVGIGHTSYYAWKAKGEKAKSGKYAEFLDTIKKAEAEAELESINRIRKAATGDAPVMKITTTDKDGNVKVIEKFGSPSWQADAWLRERKDPERWGRRDKVEMTGKDGKDLHPPQPSHFHFPDGSVFTPDELGGNGQKDEEIPVSQES